MILVIDNYDSFVQTLARYLREAGAQTCVVRNDALTPAEALAMDPDGILLSPGPGRPEDAGVCVDLIRAARDVPLLGVCLGHQCLAAAYGGVTRRAVRPMHGRASLVRHTGTGLFAGVASPMPAGRYHSLVSDPAPGGPLATVAWSEEDEPMAFVHCERRQYGVQFHPESLLTPDGRMLISNFLSATQGDA